MYFSKDISGRWRLQSGVVFELYPKIQLAV
jgi:hypothetical protein